MAKKPVKAAPGRLVPYVEPADSHVLRRKLPKDKTPAQDLADIVGDGIAANVIATHNWCEGVMMQPEVTSLSETMHRLGHEVKAGNLGTVEAMLSAQVVTMNAAFVRMMQRAYGSKYMEPFETYLRLGLRLQSQCRATAETLANMKMPPVFAKNYQANIANGPQQVNNGVPAPARAEKEQPAQTKLLEAPIEAERVDTRASGTTAGSDSAVEAVVVVNRAKVGGRKGARLSKRVQGRRPSNAARRLS